jgi:methylglutaconyl-CoA hydratase
MTEATPVLYSVSGFCARLTLNRPEKRNALNDAIVGGLSSALHEAERDLAVRVIVISGAGKDFCSGADLSALEKISGASVAENVADARLLLDLFTQIRRARVPVVAAVQGRALAGGCGLATACDLVLAAASARFGYPEVKIGFVPAMVMAILRRNVSEKRAFELITRGQEVSATEARDNGLVNQVFPDDAFDQEVQEYIQPFASSSASAVTLTKQLLYQMDGMEFGDAIQAGLDTNVIARLTEDCQKGIRKFLTKS